MAAAALGHPVESNDAFARFVDYARSLLVSEDYPDSDEVDVGPSWSWIASRTLKTCLTYSSGVTSAILLSALFQAWSEQRRGRTLKRNLDCGTYWSKKQRRLRLPNTVTIDSIYEKNFLSPNAVLEAIVLDDFVLPGTDIYMLNLGDYWSSSTIDLYLHRRYYDLVDINHGGLKKGREIFMTGCCLRSAIEGCGYPRLLPTEYLVIILDEDKDEDAILLGAHFCSDSFSSISLDAVKNGTSYSFYARIEYIGSLEIHGKYGSLQRKQIILVDNEGFKLRFFLWGDQVVIANLLSVGSMLALDRPFIANEVDIDTGITEKNCLEYGSSTQLYLVPFIQHEDQVLVTPTQNRYQGSRHCNESGQNGSLKVSQVALPCDSQGSVDYSCYPFQTFVADLQDKMSGIGLYGVVTSILRDSSIPDIVFSLTIQDITGEAVVKLHFVQTWSLGRLGLGHTVYIAGLTCRLTKKNVLEVKWFEKDMLATLVNLSCLPALLNSPCLHNLLRLSDLSNAPITQVCRVRLAPIQYHRLSSRFSHAICGQLLDDTVDGFEVCDFCCCTCKGEIVRTFYLELTLSDESGEVYAWCTGQTASELLQISPDEFYGLPEDEQAMYLYTLENEPFTVSLVNSKRRNDELDTASSIWEIARALRCD